jgi:hypothetical protein
LFILSVQIWEENKYSSKETLKLEAEVRQKENKNAVLCRSNNSISTRIGEIDYIRGKLISRTI